MKHDVSFLVSHGGTRTKMNKALHSNEQSDKVALQLNHVRQFSAWGCLPGDPNHPVHAAYTIEDIPDMVPGMNHIDGIVDIPGFDGTSDDDDMPDLNGQ